MCDYCKGKKMIEREFEEEMLGKIFYDDWVVFIDRGHLRLARKDDSECMDSGEKIKINFCPICGTSISEGF